MRGSKSARRVQAQQSPAERPDRPWESPWIWTHAPVYPRNAYGRFRRTLPGDGGRGGRIEITADARYWLWVNGVFIGFGPARAWPEHWSYDSYALAPHWRPGRNEIAVLVNHWRDGSFQYIPAEPGLSVRICADDGRVIDESGPRWKTAMATTECARAPRISVQLGFEEQHDARCDDGWREAGFDDTAWDGARVVAAPHAELTLRDIPPLTDQVQKPCTVLAVEEVAPATAVWNLSLKGLFAPNDRSSNFCFIRGFVVTSVHSARAQTVEFIRPHHHAGPFQVGERHYPAIELPPDKDIVAEPVRLARGWNQVIFPYPGYRDALAADLPAGGVHLPVFVLTVRAEHALRWDCLAGKGGAPWAFAGPFPLSAAQQTAMRGQADFPRVVQAERFPPGATRAQARRCERATAAAWAQWRTAPWFRQLSNDDALANDVFARWCGDRVTVARVVPGKGAPWQTQAGWELEPATGGRDVRVLVDFGHMLVGRIGFEIEAPAGVQVDFHGFEFIQPDGRHNLATGMNNTLRYTTRAGRQTFRSLLRRGFRYGWLVVRGLPSPLIVRDLSVAVSTYPQSGRGAFRCSESLLNQIWRTGADTMRWCAEDTYTDCPTYEQTHWVGDSRNEALVDWIVNGDARLWRHCLRQAGQGLTRLPLVPSHVPSTWENLLPAWSFLWMRSCWEYFRWTGDRAGAEELMPWVARNIAGMEANLGSDGLFKLHAWNLFDWAAMETPADGTVTHLNCLAALAMDDAARLAHGLGKRNEARRWRIRAQRLRVAVNAELWDERTQAYADCRLADGRLGNVRSQQTQVVALLAGVATGTRAKSCRDIVANAPAQFVRAGSPFFVFFQLELLSGARGRNRLLDLIRESWGFMLREGATSFWELWSLASGRLTRSHCHGWSSAPTYFLSTAVLGITPGVPGSRVIRFAPAPGDLREIAGSVPTPWGWVEVRGRRRSESWRYALKVPQGCRVSARLGRGDRLALS